MMQSLSLDDLDVVATVTRFYATAADTDEAVRDLRSWNADVDDYEPSDDEISAVLRARGLIVV